MIVFTMFDPLLLYYMLQINVRTHPVIVDGLFNSDSLGESRVNLQTKCAHDEGNQGLKSQS